MFQGKPPQAPVQAEPDCPLVEPHQLGGFLADRPVTASPTTGWGRTVLHRFSSLPSVIEVLAMRDEVLVYHLGGPFLAEVGTGTSHYQRRWVAPGQLGINPAGAPVHREIKGRPDVVLLHLPPAGLRAVAEEAFDADPSRVALIPEIAATDEVAGQLIGLLLQEATSPEPGLPLMVEGLTQAVMLHVLRRHSTLTLHRPGRDEDLSPGRTRRVIDYMKSHLDHPLSLADLAQTAGLGSSRFVRAFRAATGQPPHRFLVRLRIEEACRLLEQTDLSITEVGQRCGFDQPSHFGAMFRKLVGMAPGTWRRERRA